VVTTGQRGMQDVFTDGINGFEVVERSAASIAAVAASASGDTGRLRQMAVANRRTAGSATARPNSRQR
jgi:hypothetical protein